MWLVLKRSSKSGRKVSRNFKSRQKHERQSNRSLRLEPLEDRRLLSVTGYPELPGLHLVDPRPDQFAGQIIYLDFDGAENVTYNGPVVVEDIDVPAFKVPGELAGREEQIIAEVVAQLEATFAGTGVVFTTAQPDPGSTYSTIFVGGDDTAFRDYGLFLGLAEQVDVGNRVLSDKGFVFSDKIGVPRSNRDEYVRGLTSLVSHEVGHLLGYAHNATEQGNNGTLSYATGGTATPEISPKKDIHIQVHPDGLTCGVRAANVLGNRGPRPDEGLFHVAKPQITSVQWRTASGGVVEDGQRFKVGDMVRIYVEADYVQVGDQFTIYVYEEDDFQYNTVIPDDLVDTVVVTIGSVNGTHGSGYAYWEVQWHPDSNFLADIGIADIYPEYRLWDTKSGWTWWPANSHKSDALIKAHGGELPDGKWTVITHGLQLEDDGANAYRKLVDHTGWMWQLADKIRQESIDPTTGISNVIIHTVNAIKCEIWNESFTRAEDWSVVNDTSKHHVLLFDWAEVSNYDVQGKFWSILGIQHPTVAPPPGASGDDGYAEAAGDALYALLCKYGIADKVDTLIGHSRGAVVMSEAAERILRVGHKVDQVIFLDAEGGGSQRQFSDPAFGLYKDEEFHAWQGVEIVSIIAPLNEGKMADQVEDLVAFAATFVGAKWLTDSGLSLEDLIAMSLAATIPDVDFGGHTVDGAKNIDLVSRPTLLRYAHSGLLNVFPGVYDYLIGNHMCDVSNPGLFVLNGDICTTDTPIAPNGSAEAINNSPRALLELFNGDFEYNSTAGWWYHGGGHDAASAGGGTVENGKLVLDQGESRTHNWAYTPANAKSVEFDYVVTDTSSSSQLVVSWGDENNSWKEIGRLPLTSAEPKYDQRLDLPQGVAGKVGRLKFAVVGSDSARVYLDNISWSGASSPASTFSLTVLPGSHGDVMPKGTIEVAPDTVLELTAFPDPGYVVDKWLFNAIPVPELEGRSSLILDGFRDSGTVIVTFRPIQEEQTASLVVVNPREGSRWARKSKLLIEWNAEGFTGDVKIELYKGGSFYSVIDDSEPVAYGKKAWFLPSSLPLGSDYQIKITSLSTGLSAFSRTFSVVAEVQTTGPIEISTLSQFLKIGSGETINGRVYRADATYILTADINATGKNLATMSPYAAPLPRFEGILEGNNHKIIGLTIEAEDRGGVALFSGISSNAVVQNLEIEVYSVVGHHSVAALAERNWGTIRNVHIRIDDEGQGLRIPGSYDDSKEELGGIVAWNQGVIENCSVTPKRAGASSDFFFNSSNLTGGIAAENWGTIRWCFVNLNRFSVNHKAGGIAGRNGTSGTIHECYVAGDFDARGRETGGIAGINEGLVVDCYVAARVGGRPASGGIVGSNGGVVDRTLFTGTLAGSSQGPIVGLNTVTGTVRASFWDNRVAPTYVCDGAVALPTAELQKRLTFEAAGWDLDGIWTIDDGQGYPALRGAKASLANRVANVTATMNLPGKVIVSWEALDGADWYRVYRADSETGQKYPVSDWIKETIFEDHSIPPYKEYYYWVTAAYTSGGAGESDFSYATTGKSVFACDPPKEVWASNNLDQIVLVGWQASKAGTYYRVYRSKSADSPGTPISGWIRDLEFLDTTAVLGQQYYYRVSAALDGNGTGAGELSHAVPGAVGQPVAALQTVAGIIDLGTTAIGQEVVQKVVLSNVGSGTLDVREVQTNNPAFAVLPANTAVQFDDWKVRPFDSRAFAIKFAPSQPGSYVAQLFIVSNDPVQSPLTVELRGEAKAPPIISALNVTKATVTIGDSVELTATGVEDPDGLVTRVEFYRDDRLLGVDEEGSDGWSIHVDTSEWPIGVNTLRSRAFDSDGLWSNVVEVNVTVADKQTNAEYRFDFGTSSSPVEAGYIRVTETTTYTAQRGYGWKSGTIRSVDRATGSNLKRDLNYSQDATFVVDVPNGLYTVVLTLGDYGPYVHDQMQVNLEGASLDVVTTQPGEVVTRSYDVNVNDGQLTLRLKDLGGKDPNICIAGMEVKSASEKVELGVVDYCEIPGLPLANGERWFSLVAAHTGTLTVDSPDRTLAIRVYNEHMQQLAESRIIDRRQRLDFEGGAQGERYYIQVTGTGATVDLRITNLISGLRGERIIVWHSISDDVVRIGPVDGPTTVSGGAGVRVTVLININGMDYSLDLIGATPSLYLNTDNPGGSDVLYLYDSPKDDYVALSAFTLDAYWGFVTSPKGDRQPIAAISGGGFNYIHVYATGGGVDEAHVSDFQDGAHLATKFKWEPQYKHAKMVRSDMVLRAKMFEKVYAQVGGGDDIAVLFDTPGNDVFVGQKDTSRMWDEGKSYYVSVSGFQAVNAYATAGGRDVAMFEDSELKDVFRFHWHKSELFDAVTAGAKYYIAGRWFEQVFATAANGSGADIAKIWDTPGSDYIVLDKSELKLFQNSLLGDMLLYLTSFESVRVRDSLQGTDRKDIRTVVYYDYVFGNGWLNAQ